MKQFVALICVTFLLVSQVHCEETQDDLIDGAANKESSEEISGHGIELKHEIIDAQSDQPTSGERFYAYPKDALGASQELLPSLSGLAAIAITHLPKPYTFVSVTSAKRLVVAGVMYEIMVQSKDTTGEDTICELVVFEKPWITTEYGDKWRTLRFTNCTGDAGEEVTTPQIPLSTQVNPTFVNQRSEINDDVLRRIEAQIIQPRRRKNRTTTTTQAPVVVDEKIEVSVTEQTLSNSAMKTLDELFVFGTFQDANQATIKKDSHQAQPVTEEDYSNRQEVVEEIIVPVRVTTVKTTIEDSDQAPTTPESTPTNTESQGTTVKCIEHDEQPVLESNPKQQESPKMDQFVDSLQSYIDEALKTPETDTQQQVPVVITYMTPSFTAPHHDQAVKNELNENTVVNVKEAKQREKREIVHTTERDYVLRLANRALMQLDSIDPDEYKRIALEIVTAKKLITATEEKPEQPAVYYLTVKTGNSHCIEEDSNYELCVKQLVKGSTKLCNMEVRVVREAVEVTKSECAPVKPREKRGTPKVVGGPTPLEGDELNKLRTVVDEALVKLSSEPNGVTYTLSNVKEATKQIVAGILYKGTGEFTTANSADTVTCSFEIWDKPWVKPDGRKIDLDCGSDKKYSFRQKRSSHGKRPHPLLWDEDYPFAPPHNRQSSVSEERTETLFQKFKLKHNRVYSTAMEHALRFRIFKNNLYKIEQLNKREQGTAKYGVTEFCDLTTQEYKMRTGLLKRSDELQNHISNPIAEIPNNIELPKAFDWRDKGVISSVKNQGSCGSCWAFSVTGNIEGLHAIKTGQMEEYSEQELVDCDSIDSGCNGGLPDNAYKAIENIGGLELETEYPYHGKKETCQFSGDKAHVKVKGAVDLPKNETAMALWLLANGPISIGINANAMQFYRGGVSHPWRPLCRHSNIDHGVLIVGFGESDYPVFNKTMPYWIVKNSWGPKWGEQGYYRVYRGDNTCGINSMASSAVLE